MKELGFKYREQDYPHAPGSPQKEINLYGEPWQEHFDLVKATFQLVNDAGSLEEKSIAHPWYFEKEIRVGTGDVVLYDRMEAEERAFPFGGWLTVENLPDKTRCFLVSTAPILYITEMVDMSTILANEVEI